MPKPSVSIKNPKDKDQVKPKKKFDIDILGDPMEKPKGARVHGIAVRVLYFVNGFPMIQTFISDAIEVDNNKFTASFKYEPDKKKMPLSVRAFAWLKKDTNGRRQPPRALADIAADTQKPKLDVSD